MKDLATAIFNILKYAGKTITVLRNLIVNIIFISLIIFIIFSLFARKGEQSFEHNSALLLSIQGDIVEEKQISDPLEGLLDESLGFTSLPQETLLQDILDSIDSAADDSRINSIVLDLSDMGSCSLNQLRDIGSALITFKNSGKQVIAAEDFYSQNKYFLASYADEIYLNPVGVIDLHGLATYRLYFKDALEKLKVNYHVFRVGTFKSALEPLTRSSMSDEAKSQNLSWLNVLWQEFTSDIALRRNIKLEVLDRYTNNISTMLEATGGDAAQLALDTHLVDGLKTRHELTTYLKELTGDSHNRNFRYVTLKEYLKEVDRSYYKKSYSNSVGIIVAQGNILTGDQPPGNIGSESLVRLIRKAKNDSQVKAVVLRIDSGGGSVVASEIIRRELQELKKSGKTFVVSMASMAASGGYWISAEADEIWAHPTTLTGSIGIFGAIPTFEKSLAQLGVYSDGVGTTNLSSGLNITKPLSPEVEKAIQLSIEHGYNKFIDIVAAGRSIDRDKLELIAQGRVFDGINAKKLGLVDQLGNLDDAISAAASLEGLDTYSVSYIRSSETFTDKLLEQLQQNIKILVSNLQFPNNVKEYFKLSPLSPTPFSLFDDPKGLYAHCLINYF